MKIKLPDNYKSWIFLSSILFLYFIISFFNTSNIINSLIFAKNTLIKIIPTLLLIIVLMTIIDYLINPKKLVKYLGKNAGLKGWIITIISGIISTGPIYLWYPLLNDLQKKNMRTAYISTFLYTRAVKIPLIPMLIIYFGLKYTIILTISIILVSILQGLITEKTMEVLK